MTLLRRNLCFILFVCLGCCAQSLSPELARRIEHQIRTSYKIPPDVQIHLGQIEPSTEVPGLDVLTASIASGDEEKQYTFLLSKDRSTLMRLSKMDLTTDAFTAVMSKIDLKGRPVRGASKASVVLVSFDDFECPFCARAHAVLFPDLLKEYGDRVRFIYKDDPLTDIHPWAMHAAVDANCLAAQSSEAYWDFADYIHANRQEVDAEKELPARFAAVDKIALQQAQKHNLARPRLQGCISAQDETAVRASMEEAKDLGISGTPAIFVNGERIDGAMPVAVFRAALERALRESANSASPQTP